MTKSFRALAALSTLAAALIAGADATQFPATSNDNPVGRLSATGNQVQLRTFTVGDSIEMTQIEVSNVLSGSAVTFSPDRKRLVVVTRRGNLKKNSIDYSLLLFNSAEVTRSPPPDVLLTLSTSSNNAAISGVHWQNGNNLLFLADGPGHVQQVFSLDLRTRVTTQLTQHSTDILAFDATSDLRLIAYLARPQIASLLDDTSRARGLLVSEERLEDLIIGQRPTSAPLFLAPPEFFLKHDGKTATRVALQHRETLYPWFGVSISPDGRFAVVLSDSTLYLGPELWKEYKPKQPAFVTYLAVDTFTGQIRPLIDAPAYSGSILWAGAQSAVIGATYLPLNVEDDIERELRKTTTWTVEVDIPNRVIRKIERGNYLTMRLDAKNGTVFLRPLTDATVGADRPEDPLFAYRKDKSNWERVDPVAALALSRDEFEVQQEEGMNTPPRLFAARQSGRGKTLLLDLNPQFRGIRFGHVEEIEWQGADGIKTKGGVYLPPSYVRGQRYPLVIQTHGWSPQKFDVDGMSTAGYAAQALAGKGFVVAQVPEGIELSSPREGSQNMAMFEGLIKELSRRGLIDGARVGLLGHSRTGYSTWYMLAFSTYPIGAAAEIDAGYYGYFDYIADLNQSPAWREIYEAQNGAPAFAGGLQKWLKTALSFNLDKIHTPARQIACGPYALKYNWESFVGLRRLGKPVELIYLPDALHHPVKPSERITAQQGNVDWFSFWLEGDEDPDPNKTEQYQRWESLCDMQKAGNPGERTFCVGSNVH